MKSIISFPDRGPWGDSRWRGNCSGHVIRELIEHYRPQLFVDACEGSGTSGEVCRDLGVEYVGLDLHKGFDFTRDSILAHLPRQADVVFTHPPYWDMIDYRNVGRFNQESLADQDLSACSEEEFLEKAQTMLANQRVATKGGGIYTTLIGDYRRKGVFRSFQADFIGLMPREELEAVVIKTQHNCWSDKRQYSGNFIPILHEYLLIWRKKKRTMVQVTLDMLARMELVQQWTWKNLVRMALIHLGGQASTQEIYRLMEATPEARRKMETNQTWKATIRRTLQEHFRPIQQGVWAIA